MDSVGIHSAMNIQITKQTGGRAQWVELHKGDGRTNVQTLAVVSS